MKHSKELEIANKMKEETFFSGRGYNVEKAAKQNVLSFCHQFRNILIPIKEDETLYHKLELTFGGSTKRATKNPENGTLAGSGYSYTDYEDEEIELLSGFVLNTKEKTITRETGGWSLFAFRDDKINELITFCKEHGYELRTDTVFANNI